MADIDSVTLKTENKHMQAFGNSVTYLGKVALAANPVAADVIRVCQIPAGAEISSILMANTDLDSNAGPTFVHSIGYAPVNVANGPAAVADYFAAAGQTNLQAANVGKLYAGFDAIKFEFPVHLTLTVGTAAATFAAGSIWAQARGRSVGVK